MDSTTKFRLMKGLSVFKRILKRMLLNSSSFSRWHAERCKKLLRTVNPDLRALIMHLDERFSGREDVVFFDIGANDGSSSICYSNYFPDVKFHLFEAHPEISKIASKNISETCCAKNFMVHTFAASDENGVAQFHVSAIPQSQDWRSSYSDSSSLLAPKKHLDLIEHVSFGKVISVETKRLGDLILSGSLPKPNFIHMDVQGAELRVLEGFSEFIWQVECIWLEVEAVELYEGQPLVDEVRRFMKEKGFELCLDTVGEVAGDQLWVRSNC